MYNYDYDYYYYGYDDAAAFSLFSGPFIAIWIISLLISVFNVICMWKVFTKAGKPGWAALIPVYNFVVLLQITELPMWYIALLFIPIGNVIALFMIYIELAHRFGKSTGFGVGLALLGPIFMAILAFSKDAKYQGNQVVINAQSNYNQQQYGYGQSMNNNTYGQTSMNNNTYGQTSMNNTSYGQQPMNDMSYGQQQSMNNMSYGQQQSINNMSYGQQPNNNSYGQSMNNNSYGQSMNNNSYGQSMNNNSYGQPSMNDMSFNQPKNNTTYSQQQPSVCPNCGREVAPNNKFCNVCGTKLF